MLSNAIMLYLLLVCLYFSLVDAFTINSRNNVCRGLDDYATIGFNKNCFYNPDVDSDPKEIANRYGFAFESYKVTTEDGYILDLFRIPHNFTDKTKNRQPVILQHGIMSWGIRWMHLGNKSLPFFLVNNGYDVWISNSRGHGTTEHNNSAITPKEYWNFSFHEVGIYDLPAYISFISEITRRDGDIIYIGHSMGTTDSFVYSSLRKEHAEENLKGIIALAPVAYIKTISPIYQLFLPFLNQIQDISENIGIYGIGQLDAFSNMCNNYPTIILCRIGYELFGGIEEEQLQLALIAKRYGYPLEKYKVTTDDGYILSLYRIPHNNTDLKSKRQPVLIQHGIGATAIIWMLQGHRSLAFFLTNNGYDVWLSTARGAAFSTDHKYLKPSDPLYWNFSFHEMAVHDLPKIVELISNTTKEKGNIIYMGHSMGTTLSYIYSVIKKNHAETHLKAIISLSPVAYMGNVRGLYKLLAPVFPLLANFLVRSGMYAVGYYPIFKQISSLCGRYPTVTFCQVLLSMASGLAVEQVLPELLPVLTSYYPSGTSLKTLLHFSQLIVSRRFQFFDYGPGNVLVYNSTTPPAYNINDISVPLHLFMGQNDFIASEVDVNDLYRNLNSPRSKTTASTYSFDFAHNDFFMGKHLDNFYNTLLDVMINKIGFS